MSNTTTDWLTNQFTTANWAVNQICIPIQFFVGLIGWALNTITFLRPSLRSNSCATYFHASSWANLCVLFWVSLVNIIDNFLGYRLIAKSVVFCKIRIYFITMFCHTSVAFLLLACFDRLLLCSREANHRNLCNVRVAYKMISIAIIICALLPSYVLFTYDRLTPTTNICTVNIEVSTIDVIYKLTVWAVIPPTFMLTFGSLTIYRLKQNARRIQNIRIQIHSKDAQLSAVVIGQITLYITTTWPYVAVMIYKVLTQNVPSASKSAARNAIETFAFAFSANFCLYLFNTISFFVYTMTAPSFRRELLLALVPRSFGRRFQNQVGTMTVQQTNLRLERTVHKRTPE